MLEFGSLLRVFRSEWRLTQTEMAELLCISQPVYSRVEAGLRPIPLRALKRVADRCGTTVQTLVLAHLLLDENVAAIANDPPDGASRALLKIAAQYRNSFPDGVRDSAALGLLYDGARN